VFPEVIAVAELRDSHDDDIGGLIASRYEEVDVDETFRLSTLERTSRIIASRGHNRARRLAFGVAVGAVIAVAAAILTRHPSPPGPSGHPPNIAERPAPAAVPEAKTETPAGGGERLAAGRESETATKPATAKEATLPRRPLGVRASTSRPVPEPLVAVVAARPPVTDGAGRTIKIGERLSVGATVRTGNAGRIRLVTRHGSEFALNANSELSLVSANAARLRCGELYCRSRRGEIDRIETLAGRIHLLGTALDAACVNSHKVAVTVVSGRVRLTNEHGESMVTAGKRALMTASRPPEPGSAVDAQAAVAWYDGRGDVLSDFGEIAYTIARADDLIREIWAMDADGSNKRRVKTYLGYGDTPGPWLPGQQWLLVRSGSLLWTTPDFAARRADTHGGHPIVTDKAWLLDAATGQDVIFNLPPGYRPLYMEFSPDERKLAFCGSYQPDPASRDNVEGGIWVYDVQTENVHKVLSGWVKTPLAWSPDSSRLATSSGEGYGANYPLVVADVDSGQVKDLGVQGAGPSFSPDGRALAYSGDFTRSGSWYQGVPMSGSIFVVDLASGGEPRRISPAGEGALQPRWAPDGSRVAYWVSHDKWVPDEGPYYPGYRILVAQADGSGADEVYHRDPVDERGGLRAVSWAPDGDSLYISTADGVLLVAAAGSGVLSDLGGNDSDSVLSAQQKQQTDGAVAAIREAVFQYAVGNVRSFEGRPADARAAFAAAADIFAGLEWQYPLADFSSGNVLQYADKAAEMAQRPSATVLAQCCDERMRYLGSLLVNCAAHEGRFPSDLATIEKWAFANPWGINWISNRDAEWVKMIFKCPQGPLFVYTPPAAGEDPKAGDVLITCPNHPDCRLVWDERQAWMLAWQRQSAVRQARDKDPQLKALYETAVQLREMAEFGVATWQDAEDAHVAVLKKTPNDVETRTYLGRMYTRWGRYREALETLPSDLGALGGWAGLNRAFCLDALGERNQAVAIYQQLLQAGGSDTITTWAKLGLQQPTWPQDLDVSALPGEVRLIPSSGWHASASGSRSPGNPEFAIDDNRYTRWATSGSGHGQSPGTWFQLDFAAPQVVSRVVVDHLGFGDYVIGSWARGLEASVTSDGKTWEKVPCDRAGPIQPAIVHVDPARAITAIRLNVTAVSDPEWWSIYELYVFGPSERAR
jgi:Tol biopolymer transport system component/tetratricopeptide (TPR) repeat protein